MLTYAMLEFSYKLLYAALLVMSCTQQVLSDLLHFSSFNSPRVWLRSPISEDDSDNKAEHYSL